MDHLSSLPDEKLNFESEGDDPIQGIHNGKLWHWAEKKWKHFIDLGAKLIQIVFFQDDYDHFTSKHYLLKNMSIRITNDVSVVSLKREEKPLTLTLFTFPEDTRMAPLLCGTHQRRSFVERACPGAFRSPDALLGTRVPGDGEKRRRQDGGVAACRYSHRHHG